METTIEIPCKCVKCQQEENVVLQKIITSDKRRKAENLELFRWTCPRCGHVMKLLYPCMYLNEEKKILIWFINTLEDTGRLEHELSPEFLRKTKGYTKRFCHSLEEFGEKIRVLEENLEDRAIELLKITIFARLHVNDSSLEAVYFYRQDAMGNLEFTIFSKEGPKGIGIPYVMYEDIYGDVQKEMPALQDKFYCIDPDWAGEQVMNG